MPLLIGGATTSQVHTAVKISPNYKRARRSTCTDASRAVGVVSNAARRRARGRLCRRYRATDYAKLQARAMNAARPQDAHLARRRRAPTSSSIDWTGRHAAAARASSARAPSRDYDLGDAACRYIDWTPFFSDLGDQGHAIRMVLDDRPLWRGRAPAVRGRAGDAEPDRRGEMAEGQCGRSASGRRTASATTTSVVYADESAQDAARRRCTRCASRSRAGGGNRANTALADFIAPEGSGVADYIGGFAVTAGIGEEVHRRTFRARQ